MRDFWTKLRADVPGTFLAGLAVCVAFMGFVTWDQQHWWDSKQDYMFGYLVPFFVGYVIYDRWPGIVAALKVFGSEAGARVSGWRSWILNTLVFGTLVGGALSFLFGALIRAATGATFPSTLAISFGAGCLMMAVLFIATPETKAATGVKLFEDARVKLTLLFLFPCFVWLVSAPMVSVIEQNLSLFLMGRVTTVVFFVFDTLGMPIEQQGNVLQLPGGASVHVAEACSGIRSLTASLFVGSFLAAVFLKTFGKKVLLVFLAACLAFFTNLLRSLFLTVWAYNYGSEAIEGSVHDIGGFVVLGLTALGLMCLLPLFTLRISFGGSAPVKKKE